MANDGDDEAGDGRNDYTLSVAASIGAFTPDEWEKKGKAFASPACLGGGKKEGIS